MHDELDGRCLFVRAVEVSFPTSPGSEIMARGVQLRPCAAPIPCAEHPVQPAPGPPYPMPSWLDEPDGKHSAWMQGGPTWLGLPRYVHVFEAGEQALRFWPYRN